MKIRDLVPEDYEELIALWDEAGLAYRPRGRDGRERIVRQIEGSCSVFLAAEEDGKLVGAVLGTHDGRRGWVNRLAVLPEYRLRGVAAALVVEVEKRLLDNGIEIMTCLIEGWNEGSTAFFERIGYIAHPDIIYYSKRRSPDT